MADPHAPAAVEALCVEKNSSVVTYGSACVALAHSLSGLTDCLRVNVDSAERLFECFDGRRCA